MDQDGCTAEFTRSELERFLKTNQLLLLDKLRSESALDAAQLAGLSRCPYCPFAGIIENPGGSPYPRRVSRLTVRH